MNIEQIFDTTETSYGISPISDRVEMVKNEISDLAQRIVDKTDELTGKNSVENRPLPSVMFDLVQFIWEEVEKVNAGLAPSAQEGNGK